LEEPKTNKFKDYYQDKKAALANHDFKKDKQAIENAKIRSDPRNVDAIKEWNHHLGKDAEHANED